MTSILLFTDKLYLLFVCLLAWWVKSGTNITAWQQLTHGGQFCSGHGLLSDPGGECKHWYKSPGARFKRLRRHFHTVSGLASNINRNRVRPAKGEKVTQTSPCQSEKKVSFFPFQMGLVCRHLWPLIASPVASCLWRPFCYLPPSSGACTPVENVPAKSLSKPGVSRPSHALGDLTDFTNTELKLFKECQGKLALTSLKSVGICCWLLWEVNFMLLMFSICTHPQPPQKEVTLRY